MADNLALRMGSASVLEMVGKSVVHLEDEWAASSAERRVERWAGTTVASSVVEKGDKKAAWSVA